MTDEQYARLGARLIQAIQVWGEEAGIPKSSLALLLASAAGEIGAQEGGGFAAGAALLRSVANTLDDFAPAPARHGATPTFRKKVRRG